MSKIHTVCADCLEVMETMEEGSVDLVVIDPPYYRVATNAGILSWDDQWASFDEYTSWIGRVFDAVRRVCKPSASIYCFADDLVCAYVQIEFDKRFRLLNSLVWQKPDPLMQKGWRASRRYVSCTERILFGEMMLEDGRPKTGTEQIHSLPDCFRDLKDELISGKIRAMESLGMDEAEFGKWFSEVSGTKRMGYHYFQDYQWSLPTKAIYDRMRATGFWTRDYEDLRRDYEDLRRPFRPLAMMTDVWTFPTAKQTEDRIHPTQKPKALISRILTTSSRGGGMTVLDPFMGSGVVGAECVRLGMDYIGVEMDPDMKAKADMRITTAEVATKGRTTLEAFQ